MRTRTKLAVSLVALFSSLPLMVATGNGYFILLLLIGLPAAILFWFDLGRELRAIGFRKLSARPQHYAQDPDAIETFKKTSPTWSGTSASKTAGRR